MNTKWQTLKQLWKDIMILVSFDLNGLFILLSFHGWAYLLPLEVSLLWTIFSWLFWSLSGTICVGSRTVKKGRQKKGGQPGAAPRPPSRLRRREGCRLVYFRSKGPPSDSFSQCIWCVRVSNSRFSFTVPSFHWRTTNSSHDRDRRCDSTVSSEWPVSGFGNPFD